MTDDERKVRNAEDARNYRARKKLKREAAAAAAGPPASLEALFDADVGAGKRRVGGEGHFGCWV